MVPELLPSPPAVAAAAAVGRFAGQWDGPSLTANRHGERRVWQGLPSYYLFGCGPGAERVETVSRFRRRRMGGVQQQNFIPSLSSTLQFNS